MGLKDTELESMDWIDLEIRRPNQRQTSSQTKYNFQDNSSKRSPQRDTHLPHRMLSPHLSKTQALSVNAQTTTATTPPGASYLQPPYTAVHHDTNFRIVNSNLKTQ